MRTTENDRSDGKKKKWLIRNVILTQLGVPGDRHSFSCLSAPGYFSALATPGSVITFLGASSHGAR